MGCSVYVVIVCSGCLDFMKACSGGSGGWLVVGLQRKWVVGCECGCIRLRERVWQKGRERNELKKY